MVIIVEGVIATRTSTMVIIMTDVSIVDSVDKHCSLLITLLSFSSFIIICCILIWLSITVSTVAYKLPSIHDYLQLNCFEYDWNAE